MADDAINAINAQCCFKPIRLLMLHLPFRPAGKNKSTASLRSHGSVACLDAVSIL